MACMQAVSELLEQHSRQFASSVKDILDPKKLSAGAGAPAGSAEGPRAAHGSATSKWQVWPPHHLHHPSLFLQACTDRHIVPCWESCMPL